MYDTNTPILGYQRAEGDIGLLHTHWLVQIFLCNDVRLIFDFTRLEFA